VTVLAGGGADRLGGGDGDDVLIAGTGIDVVDGGRGADRVSLGPLAGPGHPGRPPKARERAYLGDGDDRLWGSNDGPMSALGGDGDDQIFAGWDGDVLVGGAGDDLLAGGAGRDELHGGAGDDRLAGGTDDDQLYGEAGSDVLAGGSGDDELLAAAGDDVLLGGDGRDYLDAGAGDDTLSGDADDDTLYGGDGDDRLEGGAGIDYLEGSTGTDALFGGAGNDVLSGGAGDDMLDAGAADDVVYSGPGADRVDGGTGDDTLFGQPGDDATGVETATPVDPAPAADWSTFIDIDGDAEFQARVRADLDLLAASPDGSHMLTALRDSGVPIRIQPTGAPNAFAIESGGDGGRLIEYNPRFDTLTGDGPPIVALYHEMAHVYDYDYPGYDHNAYNQQSGTDQVNGRPVDNGERVAVGLPIDDDQDPATPNQLDRDHPTDLTENALRAEMGIAHRDRYGFA
jgi:Ca2+-binding RTX toxin-like protein